MAFGIMHTIEKATEMLVGVIQMSSGKKMKTITKGNFRNIEKISTLISRRHFCTKNNLNK